jgi:hypothetical protein
MLGMLVSAPVYIFAPNGTQWAAARDKVESNGDLKKWLKHTSFGCLAAHADNALVRATVGFVAVIFSAFTSALAGGGQLT